MRKQVRKRKRQKQLLSHCLWFSGAFWVHVVVAVGKGGHGKGRLPDQLCWVKCGYNNVYLVVIISCNLYYNNSLEGAVRSGPNERGSQTGCHLVRHNGWKTWTKKRRQVKERGRGTEGRRALIPAPSVLLHTSASISFIPPTIVVSCLLCSKPTKSLTVRKPEQHGGELNHPLTSWTWSF